MSKQKTFLAIDIFKYILMDYSKSVWLHTILPKFTWKG